MYLDNKNETYEADLKLFHDLNLQPFKTYNSPDEVFVGEYKLPQYKVACIKIFVTEMSAQFFWRFEIITVDNRKVEIQTASGSLSDYWDSIMLIANGLIVVKYKEY